MQTPAPLQRARNASLLILLAFCWGPSFFFIKLVLKQYPPITLVACRLFFAGSILYIILKSLHRSLWQYRHIWHRFAIMAFFASAFPFVLITYAEEAISSSLAGIINSSSPIFTALLAHHFIDSEKLTLRKIVGIVIGISGILLTFLPSVLHEQTSSIYGIMAVVIASICYAIGMVYSRRYLLELPPLVGPTAQLLFGSAVLIPLSLFIDKPWTCGFPTALSLWSMAGLVLFGTIMAFVLYYAIIRLVGATYLSTSTMLFPFVAIFLGVIFLNETIGWTAYAGTLLIITGLVIAHGLLRWQDIMLLFGKKRFPQ